MPKDLLDKELVIASFSFVLLPIYKELYRVVFKDGLAF